MSRLTQPPVRDGDALNAASLNNRFSQFTQSGTLDAFNTRDAAFDLPQFVEGVNRFLMPSMFSRQIGYNIWKHGTYNTVTGQVTGAAPHVVSDGTPTPTPLSFGPLGVTLTPNVHALRVYWDLSIRPRWVGQRPWLGGALNFSFPHGGGQPPVLHFSGYGCWAFWLQWDVTSNALANFVNVPGQATFNVPLAPTTRGAALLSDCEATSIMQNVIETAAQPTNGKTPRTPLTYPMKWTSVDGAWHNVPTVTPVTVYGVRVVFSGPFGAHNAGGRNYLIRNDDVAADARLDYNGGGLSAVVMRVK